MNKYFDGAIVLTSIFSLGMTTISLAESRIYEPSNKVVKDLQLQRLDNSLAINLRNLESYTPAKPIKQKPKQEPIPEIAINLIKEFEGFKDYAYIDTDGTPVIGYGLSRINGVPVRIGDRITPSEADSALDAHLQEIQQELAKVVKVELTEQQLSALASISFNVGVGAIKNSTLLRKINAQDYAGAANEFLRWDKTNMRGRLVQLPGLSRRRAAERSLFLQN
ncbi:MAG: lysozyme, partial [Cyanobacteria bacterium J06635_13]